MDAEQWSADRTLSPTMVGELLAEQFPALKGAAVRRLGEGWDSEAFEVGGAWIFRFPKRREVQVALGREHSLLPALRAKLPLPIPDFAYLGKPSTCFPYAFVGYRKLSGMPLQRCLHVRMSAAGQQRVARQLGRFLSALHGVDTAALPGALPRVEPGWAGAHEPQIDAGLPHLAALDPGLCRRVERLVARLSPIELPPAPYVLAHADLDVEHILVDLEAERITGVIDWGDMQLAPCLADFVGIYGYRGRAFLDQVLASYGTPFGPEALAWLAKRHLGIALRNLAYGRLARQPDFVAAAIHGLRQVLDEQGYLP